MKVGKDEVEVVEDICIENQSLFDLVDYLSNVLQNEPNAWFEHECDPDNCDSFQIRYTRKMTPYELRRAEVRREKERLRRARAKERRDIKEREVYEKLKAKYDSQQ
jgi:hypothetical protein